MKKNQLFVRYFLLSFLFLITSFGFAQVKNDVITNDLNTHTFFENNDPTGLLRWRREHPELFQQQHKTRTYKNAHQSASVSTSGSSVSSGISFQLNAQNQEQVVNFDDIEIFGSYHTVPNPYQGFTWTVGPSPLPGTCTNFSGDNLAVLTEGSGCYEAGKISHPNVAYNQFAGRPIEIVKSDGSSFTFVSGYFTAAFHTVHISFQGYNGSTLVKTSSVYTLSNTEPLLIALNWSNITKLVINIEETDCRSHIVMDDFTFRNDGVITFTLINADTDEDILELKDGDVIDLTTLPAVRLNIRANTNPGTVDRVVFELSGLRGLLHYNHTENTAPYALFSDINGNYLGIMPPIGEYNLKATAYAERGGSGEKGATNTISFRVVNTMPITSLDPKLKADAAQQISSSLKAKPNPFRGVTTINFSVPQSGYTTLELIDQRGAIVQRLYAAQANANQVYTLPFTSKQSNSGVYILRLISGKYVQTFKLLLMPR